VAVVPRTTGIITEVFVEEGDRVESGQVLAVIDQRPARSTLEEAELALRDANEQLPVLALLRAEAA
jgi:multidrug resistance efflux pump